MAQTVDQAQFIGQCACGATLRLTLRNCSGILEPAPVVHRPVDNHDAVARVLGVARRMVEAAREGWPGRRVPEFVDELAAALVAIDGPRPAPPSTTAGKSDQLSPDPCALSPDPCAHGDCVGCGWSDAACAASGAQRKCCPDCLHPAVVR